MDETGKPIDRRALTQFRPGAQWRGNTKGRGKGTRNKVADAFCRDLLELWEEHGPSILRAAALKNPVQFIQVIAHIIPRDFQLDLEAGPAFRGLWAALADGKVPEMPADVVEDDG